MNMAEIYARFSADADKIYRRGMALAGRHRVLRVHHVLRAALNTRVDERLLDDVATEERAPAKVCTGPETGETGEGTPVAPGFAALLDTIRPYATHLAALVAHDRAGCVERPMTNSPTMRRVLRSAAADAAGGVIEPWHLVLHARSRWAEEVPAGPAAGEFSIDDTPSAAELVAILGAAVTEADLEALRVAVARERNADRRAWLAYKLYYLLELG